MNAQLKQKSGTFLIFLAISFALWLMKNMSKEHGFQSTYTLKLENAPADQYLDNATQVVAFSFKAKGREGTIRNLKREDKRVVTISLDKVKIHNKDGYTYYFSSQIVAEELAKLLKVDVDDINMTDPNIYFEMQPLKSEVVPIVLRDSIQPQQQYERYGLAIIEPATVTIYGPEEALKSTQAIETELLEKKDIKESFTQNVALKLGDKIQCDTKEVSVSIQIEKMTEKELEIPITPVEGYEINFQPSSIKVKCLVVGKDWDNITETLFKATVNREDVDNQVSPLPVTLEKPEYVKNCNIQPESVDYLIINKMQ